MGKRARRGGVTNAMLKTARAASMARDEEAQQIARRVYGTAVGARAESPPMALAIWAPLLTAAELAAHAMCDHYEDLEVTEENVNEIAAYLTVVFRTAALDVNGAWLTEYRAAHGGEAHGAAHGGPEAGERRPPVYREEAHGGPSRGDDGSGDPA